MHALILGARAPACLEWARALTAEHWQVTVADSLCWPLTKFSAAGKNYWQLPEPRKNPAAWIAALKDLVKTRKIDWIIPTCEEVFYLAWGAEKLKPHCHLFTSSFSLLATLHHKGLFADMTQNWPVKSPKTHILKSRDDVMEVADRSESYVFKPAFSRFATQTLLRPGIDSLAAIRPTLQSPWVAQEFIAGKEHCSFSLIQHGKLITHACYHPRYRVGRGSGIYFEVTHPAAIENFVQNFARETGYTGQVGFDFIEDDSGKLFVLECNPRATSGVHLFNNNSSALLKGITLQDKNDNGQQSTQVLRPTHHPRMSAMGMLLFAATKHGWKKTFWQDYKRAQDIITHNGEYKPHYAQLLGLLEMTARVLQKRCSLLAAVTADIEWDGQPMDARSDVPCN
ncbi:MAG: ATP-grasp domain-containing protein [Gammaproteobacteria bacterium]|nr:MAG: ATP-grasp domain-containing protein [Gammaproteobacteria bacterium]